MPPAWFNEEYFIGQKVIQANELNYDKAWLSAKGAQTWTAALVKEYIGQYTLEDGSHITAYDNFVACNAKDYGADVSQNQVNVSGTPYFVVDEYLDNLVAWANGPGKYSAGGVAAGKWTPAAMESHIFNDLHMSLWEPWSNVGIRAQINPSDSFDTHAYLQSYARAQQAAGNADFTVADAINAMVSGGINPIESYFSYGRYNGIEITAPGTATPPTIR